MNSFRNRIFLTFLLLSLGLMTVLGYWHYRSIRWIAFEEFKNSVQTISRQLSNRALIPIFTENLEQLNELASEAASIFSLNCMMVFNSERKCLISFSKGSCSNSEQARLGEFFATSPKTHLFEKQFTLNEPVFLESIPVEGKTEENPKMIGSLVLCFKMDEIERQLSSVTWNFALAEIVIAVVFGFLMLFLEKWVRRPLMDLDEKVQSIARGDLTIRVNVPPSGDEIARLSEHINQMADSLENHTSSLEKIIEVKTGEIEIRERQLMIQEKMASLGRLSANLAHEINNPLNFISLGLDFLEMQEAKLVKDLSQVSGIGPNERSKVFGNIRNGCERMKRIVDSLRKFSRADENILAEYSIREVIEDSLRVFQLDKRMSEVRVETEFSWSGQRFGSPVRAQQIILNFLSNTLDAFEGHPIPGKTIRFELRERAGFAVLLFSDNGPGIPPELRPKVFEPFFTTKPAGKGTGLGLALCFELASREGGSLRLTESGLGGAGFELELPLRKQEEETPDDRSGKRKEAGSSRPPEDPHRFSDRSED